MTFKIGDKVILLLPAYKGQKGIITGVKSGDYDFEVNTETKNGYKNTVPVWREEIELDT